MHWHGEQFTLPEGAVALAHSAQTEVQAFRLGNNAWGMLFHLEVDDDFSTSGWPNRPWLLEAQRALGADYREQLSDGLTDLSPTPGARRF